MKSNLPKTNKILSFIVAMVLACCILAPQLSFAGDEMNTIIVNDSEVGTGNFKFEFHGAWVHEGGYPQRFVGGDEHWTTTAVFGSDYPGVTFRFIGDKVALYGHKVPDGAMARVTVDGSDKGVIDLYNPSRIEKVLLYESEELELGEHSVSLRLIADKNPKAGGGHEASIDYAVVSGAGNIKPEKIAPESGSIVLEPGMEKQLVYRFLPDYAADLPEVSFESSDTSVAEVSQEGVVKAVRTGEAKITLRGGNGEGSLSATVNITVREPKGGLLVAIAGMTDTHTGPEDYDKLFRKLTGNAPKALTAVAWQNDAASVKFDVLTKGEALTGVRALPGSFTNEKGEQLDGVISVYFLKNVLAHDTGNYVPDVLFSDRIDELPASSVTSVWVRIDTGADAKPGTYSGNITVSSSDPDVSVDMPLSIEVIGLRKPDNSTALELWQYPYSSNRYYSGKTTEEYFGQGIEGLWNTHLDPAYEAGLRSQLELYAAAGGNSVTVTVTEDPWNSQTPDPYPSMVKWIQKEDGTFTYDYTDFDYFVELCSECGINGRILAFSMADWANRITYYSEKRGRVVSESPVPGSKRWKTLWTGFLKAFMEHTKEKGWFERVHMAMDERPADVVETVLDAVESVRDENGSCFKTALAVFTFDTEYMFDRVTDLSLAIAMDPAKLQAVTAHRRELGLATTFYTCGAQCSALSNPPYESVYSIWYTAKMGADGLLRWAYDAFNADPLDTSEHRLFAAGDIYLIYPDVRGSAAPAAHSSARFEMLSEGVRDVTKLRWLRDNYPEFAEEIDAALAGITSGSADSIHAAQQAVNDVARNVAKKLDPGTDPGATPGGNGNGNGGGDRDDRDEKSRSGLSTPAKIGIAAGIAGIAAIILAVVLIGLRARNKILDGPGMVNSYRQISQEEAKEMMKRDDGHVVVDVRRRDEYDAGHIPGAILIPNESIGTERPAELPDLKQVILVYCRSGRRSKEAAQKLFDMGYTSVFEFGGILDWTGDVVTDTNITFINEAENMDVWILPETDGNLKTTLWGRATLAGAKKGESYDLKVSKPETVPTFIFRAIDEDKIYYEANGITLEAGCSMRLKKEEPFTFMIEVIGNDGNSLGTWSVFAAAL